MTHILQDASLDWLAGCDESQFRGTSRKPAIQAPILEVILGCNYCQTLNDL